MRFKIKDLKLMQATDVFSNLKPKELARYVLLQVISLLSKRSKP